MSRVSANREVLTQGTAAYAIVGRRFGNLIPFASVSAFRPAKPAARAEGDWGALLGDPAASVLQATAVHVLNIPRVDQRTLALGLRWDLHPQAALKFQWDRIQVQQNGYGLWSTLDTTSRPDSQVSLLSVTLDWVF